MPNATHAVYERLAPSTVMKSSYLILLPLKGPHGVPEPDVELRQPPDHSLRRFCRQSFEKTLAKRPNLVPVHCIVFTFAFRHR